MTDVGMDNFMNDVLHHIIEVPQGYEAFELMAWMQGYNDAIERVILLYDKYTKGQKE